MRLALTESFQRHIGDLAADQRAAVFEVILALPAAFADPHGHAGLGLRKLHASGIFEARVGLGLRLVFTFDAGTPTLVRAGRHDDIRRFLRSL